MCCPPHNPPSPCPLFCCSVAQSCPTAACQASLSITSSRSLLKLVSIKSVMPSNHLILCHPHLPPSIFPSIKVFTNESVLHIRWPKCSSYSFSISPSNEYSGLTSFRIDWFDFLAVHGTLKSLLQHHSLKASILWCSAVFIVQLSHPYMFSSVQSLHRVLLFVTPWTAAHQASLSVSNSWRLLKLMSIELVMPSNHLILCRPLLLLPPIPQSRFQ